MLEFWTMRYLYTADGDELFAYAPGRRDFFRASDDTLWAHESHEWLVSAASGEAIAHRTGDVYYGAVNGERLYREALERLPEKRTTESAAGGGRRSLRSARAGRA
jgi:hypothetical protein